MDPNQIKELATEYYVNIFKDKFATFSGRARRREFWYFALFGFIASLVLWIVDNILGTGILSLLYILAAIIPSFALGARRLHDIGKSEIYLALALIPILGWLPLLYYYVQDSQPGANQYGPNPKSRK